MLDSLTAVALLRDRGIARRPRPRLRWRVPGPAAGARPPGRASVLLVEPIGKKARFLETVVDAIGVGERVEVAAARAETLAADPAHRGRWPAVTARAVASLADLVELGFPLLAPGGVLVAWKRGDLVEEVAAAQRAIEALGGGAVTSVRGGVAGLEDHRLVVVTRRGRVPPGYPRDPAARKRRPW